ncbi:hypothetical protein C8R43DRAFT_1006198 [Mycena crocata]|nr:hypothetical protein C8R43DRAFT_1006198 [Mycena crocata]
MPHKAFVDSSHHRYSATHTHLRPETILVTVKFPMTHTRSLASVSPSHDSRLATKAIAFPTSPHQCDLFPWPESPDADSGSGCGGLGPEPRLCPRARTGHVQTPRTTLPTPKRTPNEPKPKVPTTPKPKVPKRRVRTPKRSSSEATASRISALVESSISHNLRMRVDAQAVCSKVGSFGDRHELLKQDELLLARLGATLRLRHPVPAPRANTISPRPPSASVLLSRNTDLGTMPPPSTIPIKPSIRFPTSCAPAGRRGSVSSNVNIYGGPRRLPALVAMLILQRSNERESATRRAVQPRVRAPVSTSCAARTSSPAEIPTTNYTSTSRWPRKQWHGCHKPSPLGQDTGTLLLREGHVVL